MKLRIMEGAMYPLQANQIIAVMDVTIVPFS